MGFRIMKFNLKLSKIFEIKHKEFYRCIYSETSIWPKDCDSETKKAIEKYWIKRNEGLQVNKTLKDDKDKFYVLSMFPYPSGKLHMGHVRVYAISDAIARFQRMRGKNVIHPMGWDAFGLPAENAAIERNEKPDLWTKENISTMKKQLMDLGISFDWDRELATCDPSYYKWTQHLFLKLHQEGLVYRRESVVNWDPIDNTVLADEQVDEKGCSWRSGAKVEKKKLKQWFIRTTVYSKQLYERLADDDKVQWRDVVKLQRHWIGECTGYTLDFNVLKNNDSTTNQQIPVWTEHLDQLDQAKFIAIPTDHFLCQEKTTSLEAINPLNKRVMPILVSDNLEYPTSTNSKLCFPTFNANDNALAMSYGNTFPLYELMEKDVAKDPMETAEAERIFKHLKASNVFIYPASKKLRDWLISRQRYWGTPIPMIHCEKCGEVPVPLKNLPVILPKLDDLTRTVGVSPLDKVTEWKNTTCPKCGGAAQRETDTMDTFVDSSWYYLRYLDVNNPGKILGKDKIGLMPVDVYIGGKEHATLHLYYARFMSQFCYNLGLMENPEPFRNLLSQGMVMGETFKLAKTGKYLKPDEVSHVGKKVTEKATGENVVVEWEKMSKSKHNGVDPQEIIDAYGVDALRLFILSDVAPQTPRKWNSDRFNDLSKWMRKLWMTVAEFRDYKMSVYHPESISNLDLVKHEKALYAARNYYLKGATGQYIFHNQISVAISKLQALTTSLRGMPRALWVGNPQFEMTLAKLIIALTPIMPHFAAELWEGFRSIANPDEFYDTKKELWEQSWPKVDEDFQLELKIKINNKIKTIVNFPRTQLDALTQADVLTIAYSDEVISKQLKESVVNRIIHEHYHGVVYNLEFLTQAKKG